MLYRLSPYILSTGTIVSLYLALPSTSEFSGTVCPTRSLWGSPSIHECFITFPWLINQNMAVWSLRKQRGTEKDIRGLRPTINTSPLSRRRNSVSHFIPGPADSHYTAEAYGPNFRPVFAMLKTGSCSFCDMMMMMMAVRLRAVRVGLSLPLSKIPDTHFC
jgi:hypothetical protein